MHTIFVNRYQTSKDGFALALSQRMVSRLKHVRSCVNTWCDDGSPWDVDLTDALVVTRPVYDSFGSAYVSQVKEEILSRLGAFVTLLENCEDLQVDWEGRDWKPAEELSHILQIAEDLPRLKYYTVPSQRKDQTTLVRAKGTRENVEKGWVQLHSQNYVMYPGKRTPADWDNVIPGLHGIHLTGDEEEYESEMQEAMLYGRRMRISPSANHLIYHPDGSLNEDGFWGYDLMQAGPDSDEYDFQGASDDEDADEDGETQQG